MPTKEKVTFREEVLRVLKETPINDFMKTQIRIVKFYVNDEPKETKLEKRTILTFQESDRNGKAVGFNKSDWDFLLKIRENVSELLG